MESSYRLGIMETLDRAVPVSEAGTQQAEHVPCRRGADFSLVE